MPRTRKRVMERVHLAGQALSPKLLARCQAALGGGSIRSRTYPPEELAGIARHHAQHLAALCQLDGEPGQLAMRLLLLLEHLQATVDDAAGATHMLGTDGGRSGLLHIQFVLKALEQTEDVLDALRPRSAEETGKHATGFLSSGAILSLYYEEALALLPGRERKLLEVVRMGDQAVAKNLRRIRDIADLSTADRRQNLVAAEALQLRIRATDEQLAYFIAHRRFEQRESIALRMALVALDLEADALTFSTFKRRIVDPAMPRLPKIFEPKRSATFKNRKA